MHRLEKILYQKSPLKFKTGANFPVENLFTDKKQAHHRINRFAQNLKIILLVFWNYDGTHLHF